MSDSTLRKDVGLHVAAVMTSFRTQAALVESKFGRWLLAHDTHDEYYFAVEHLDAVTILPAERSAV